MNTRDQLNQYLRGLETRLRWLAVSKGAAIAAGVALGVTLALVLVTNALAFSSTSLTVARVVLFLALAVALGFALVLPLMRLNQRRAANRAETTFPEFEERLLTFVERERQARSDARPAGRGHHVGGAANRAGTSRAAANRFSRSRRRRARPSAVLIWLILGRPGIFRLRSVAAVGRRSQGHGRRVLRYQVDPGNKLVRRKADQMVTATLTGFQAPQVQPVRAL